MISPKTVTLIDSAGLWADASLGLKLACMPMLQRVGLKQTRRGARWVLRHVLTHRRLPVEHEAALAEYIFASAARSDIRTLARAYALFGGWRGQREVLTEQELRAIGARTLIIWGERDRFLPAPSARFTAALAAGARLRIIPSAGHSPNWEAPDEVLEAVFDFVRSTRGETEA
jgi:pimeloyl-ACP methyl ester carboxylesterase